MNHHKQKYLAVSGILVFAIIQSLLIFPLLDQKQIGNDYALFLPQLLNGLYHFIQNDFFSLPWFTPAMCGGVPYFPDLNSVYFSVPQLLSFWINPIDSIKITFILFSFFGGYGFFCLLNSKFKLAIASSLLSACLFIFNTFFASRMMIGHLNLHSFMLLPWLAYGLLPSKRESWPEMGINCGIVTICASYVLYSGGVNLIVPIAISVALIGLIYSYQNGTNLPWKRIFCILGLTALICSAKLHSALSLMENFPRDQYKLPGWDSILHLGGIVVVALFGHLNETQFNTGYSNFNFDLLKHEYEYSVGLLPLLAILTYLAMRGRAFFGKLFNAKGKLKLLSIAIAALLLIPILVNLYSPGWNSFLKQLPVLKNSSTLVRWFIVYIPFIILIAVLALEGLRLRKGVLRLVCFTGLGVILIQALLWDKSYFKQQSYSPTYIVKEWQRATATKTVTAINAIIDGKAANDQMVLGYSNLACYQPIFGYTLKSLPTKSIVPGPVNSVKGSYLNFKNPACYLFPKENSCQIGDHFKVSEMNKLRQLAHYKQFNFNMPKLQHLANYTSIVSLIFLIGLFILSTYCWCRKKDED